MPVAEPANWHHTHQEPTHGQTGITKWRNSRAEQRQVFISRSALVLFPNLKLGLSVIPAQAGNQFPRFLDPRLRGDDEPENQMWTERWHPVHAKNNEIRTLSRSG